MARLEIMLRVFIIRSPRDKCTQADPSHAPPSSLCLSIMYAAHLESLHTTALPGRVSCCSLLLFHFLRKRHPRDIVVVYPIPLTNHAFEPLRRLDRRPLGACGPCFLITRGTWAPQELGLVASKPPMVSDKSSVDCCLAYCLIPEGGNLYCSFRFLAPP